MEYVIKQVNEEYYLYKKDIKAFLDWCYLGIKNNEYLDEEELKYFRDENEYLINEVKDLQDLEIICLYENAMSGWFMLTGKTYTINEI